MMRRLLAGTVLLLGGVSAVQAQQVAGASAGLQLPQIANNFSMSADQPFALAVPSALAAPFTPVVPFTTVAPARDPGDLLNANVAPSPVSGSSSITPGDMALADPAAVSSAALSSDPDPSPDPKFLYGGRDDYRWQLGLGAVWERFRSSIFNASAVGLNTSISYYLNDWLGVEGNVLTAFAPEIFDREHVKLLNLTGGPRIAWRQRRWEPWAHGLIGWAHEQPQTADNTRNAFAVQVGGGADYRINPRLSLRLEGDWLRTEFFSQSQNNFTLMGGAVIHF